ncbi:GNAT family N-acetyltransferase [Kribbella pratensis]|uniref:Acetyltransferase (GNAT) family protein n=1 Tax=Kribbella pratensis TaxID=2512112 RepID=A0A4R8C607_9ACTN|nr:N-acetyltransferase [Kribbella pratensis]TDW70621.1 acetyltransferase (GNAT) family protein [Kribbella pratensis]
MIAEARMDSLMNQAWPAADNTELDGWLVRRNAGVTLRANSVLPANAPFDVHRALDYVENLYRAHDITPSFQISPAVQPSDLDVHLEARGYAVRNPTLVQCAALPDVLAKLPVTADEVNISTSPSAAWMDCWWSVDGRGGAASRTTAEQILARGKALYASIPDGEQVKAIGRLALVDDTAGLYCLAVDERFRRQGLASAVIRGLLQAATARWVWLSVLEDNIPARTLYDNLGFRTVSRYHYRVKA